MKCLESGMNDLAGEQSDSRLVPAIAVKPVVISFECYRSFKKSNNIKNSHSPPGYRETLHPSWCVPPEPATHTPPCAY